jgi:tetratricopeptide (TPR) repeat protein
MPSVRDQLQPTVDHAVTLHQQGKVAAAEQIYRQVIAQDPGNPDALHLLGLIAQDAGNYAAAVELMNRAIASEPGIPLYRVNLAKVFRGINRLDDALASVTRAAELNSRFVEAHVERAACLKSMSRFGEAERVARQAVQLAPDRAETHGVLGNVYADQGKLDAAIFEYQNALRIHPNFGEAVSNLGEALRKLGRYDEAETYFRQAIGLTPNVGEPHFNLAITLLVRGQFEEGWREYEWRWRQIGVHPRKFDALPWDGTPLHGKTILLYGEQGLGDTIQFIRYAPLVKEQRGAGRIIVQCDRPVARLVRSVAGVDEVVRTDAPLPALPAIDVHCPIVSLPMRLKTTLGDIPNRVPYIAVDPAEAAAWRRKLALSGDVLNIGLVWAGSAVNKNDRNRSAKLSDFAPLAKIPGIRWINLQHGLPAEQLKQKPAKWTIDDPTPDVRDFSDAALMTQLDLILTVDTSVAHVAGALGCPTWVLLPHVPDFRWLLERADSPWYPTMRLFRQERGGDWRGAIDQVAAALGSLRSSK